MLSPALAQEIASDTSAIIGFNVLITDGEGVVIGSGDERRVGTFHEASVEVMRSHEPAWHSTTEARELEGVRQGMTLPLVLDGVAVGTVGITGAPQRVRRFGLVVKRQTEILLEESATLRTQLMREHALERMVGTSRRTTTTSSTPSWCAPVPATSATTCHCRGAASSSR